MSLSKGKMGGIFRIKICCTKRERVIITLSIDLHFEGKSIEIQKCSK